MAYFYSVIICTWNRQSYLTQCLAGLKALTFPIDQFEILVIDNNSTDSTQKLVEEAQKSQKNLRLVFEGFEGVTYARNRGIREASGDIVCFIDDDAVPKPDWLAELDAAWRSYPEMGLIGGRIIPNWGVPKIPKWMTQALVTTASGLDCGDSTEAARMGHYLIAANLSYRKSLLPSDPFCFAFSRSAGKLNSGEESFLNFCLMAKGARALYAGRAAVVHFIAPDRLTLTWQARRYFAAGRCDFVWHQKEFSERGISSPVFRAYWIGRTGLALAKATALLLYSLVLDPWRSIERSLVIIRQFGRLAR